MSTGTLLPAPWLSCLDANGNPIAGAKGTFTVAGTATPTTTYSDVGLLTPNTNPVIADSAGRMGPIYLVPGTAVKLILKDANDTLVRTQDNIGSVPTSGSTVDVLGTAGESIVAGVPVYLSDGSGGKTQGVWYTASSANDYSSIAPVVGMAPVAVGLAMVGAFRLSGSVTGLAGLSTGTPYGIGAGVLSTTFQRYLGVADTTTSLILAPSTPFFAGDIRRYTQAPATLTIAANAITVDLRSGNVFYVSVTAAINTITVSNWTASKSTTATIRFLQDGSGHAVTLPGGWKSTNGVAPTVSSTASKASILVLYSDDGGTTIYVAPFVVGA